MLRKNKFKLPKNFFNTPRPTKLTVDNEDDIDTEPDYPLFTDEELDIIIKTIDKFEIARKNKRRYGFKK